MTPKLLNILKLLTLPLLLACGGAGCSALGGTVLPPRSPACPATVYLTDYGRHSSILLPTRDGHLVEFAFGDFNWFAVNQTRMTDALRSLFFSAGSTLGRRELRDIDDTAELARATGALKVTRFTVDAARADELRDELNFAYDERFYTEVFNPVSDMYFVRVPEPYSGLHNCNHVTARWLRDLGCEVKGPTITSKFVVQESDVVKTQPPPKR